MRITLTCVNKVEHNDKAPLILFPPIMGGYFCYADLLKNIDDRTVLAFDMDVDENEDDTKTLNDLAKKMLNLLLQEIKAGPFLFLGWSYGGILAEQVTRQIAQERREEVSLAPCYLIIIDTPPLSAMNKLDNKEFNKNLDSVITLLAKNGGIDHEIEIDIHLSKQDQVRSSFSALMRNLSNSDISEDKKNILLNMSKTAQKNMELCFDIMSQDIFYSSDMLETINRMLIISTKESSVQYNCYDLGWFSNLASGSNDRLELISTCDTINHFSVIKDEAVLNRIQGTIARWNRYHHFDEIHAFLYRAVSIKSFIGDEKSRNYVNKSIGKRFSTSLKSPHTLFSSGPLREDNVIGITQTESNQTGLTIH